MCGICGYIGPKDISNEKLIEMNDTMYHRGPNDAGIFQKEISNGVVGFAQRRLSILDLSELGHQPMLSEDENYILSYNGEIYNYRIIRAELEKKGYKFKSDCDTEVVLAAFAEWDVQAFQKFNGMFAIAIYVFSEERLVLARDRIGKKPLYYYKKNNHFVFASELKPIMKYPYFSKEIRKESVGRLLCDKYIVAPETIFFNTYKMIPGTYAEYVNNQLTVKKYWDIVEVKEEKSGGQSKSYDTHKKELKDVLLDAVSKRMIADVPLGTFLSGGIDSVLVTALAQEISDKPLDTFTIGFYDKQRNEAPYAAEIAKHIGTNHHELYVGEKEILEMIHQLPCYYDEPFSDSSQLPTMLVSKMASENITVALTGDGADELFCGYKMYDWTWIAQHFDALGGIAHIFPFLRNSGNIDPQIRAFVNNRNKDTKTQLYIDVMVELAEKLLTCDLPFIKYEQEHELKYKNWQERRMVLDMQTYLPDEILAKTDRASMKYSLEVRCPILDYRVIEKSFEIPHKYKYYRFDKKHILKDVLYEYVPQSLLDRPKNGFGVPLRKWIRTVLKQNILQFADKEKLKKQGIFNPEAVWELINKQQLSDHIMYSSMVWSFYVFQLWYQEYIEDLW